MKSRLQSPQGFLKAGGFKDVYRGLQYVAAGSVPSAASFFITYDFSKHFLLNKVAKQSNGDVSTSQKSLIHLTAASLGEIAACCVRVPVENMKLRNQTTLHAPSFSTTLKSLCYDIQITRGIPVEQISNKVTPNLLFSSLYRGFFTTVFRDVPFAMIQFPIYELLKEQFLHKRVETARKSLSNAKKTEQELRDSCSVSVFEAALSGSISGSIAATMTTPLDVTKTRLMLGRDSKGVPYKGAFDAASRVYHEGGIRSLFAGVVPRVIWISLGGAIFLGAYEFMSKKLNGSLH